jgi:hypothetical protein
MSTDTKLFHMRQFLNDEKGSAIVEATVEHTEYDVRSDGKRSWNIDGTLHITDCSRSVELSTYVSNLDEARSVLRKLDRLSDAVQGMRDAIARCARREFPGRKL